MKNTMRELRETPVRSLSAEECKRLLYHHHGGSLPAMRRKAYLLKGHPGKETVWFKPAEIKAIQRAIDDGI